MTGKTKQQIIIDYLTALRRANEPLYDYEKKEAKAQLIESAKWVSIQMLSDLKYLGDKGLILKYKLEPRVISSKYCGLEFDEVFDGGNEYIKIRDNDRYLDIVKLLNGARHQLGDLDD